MSYYISINTFLAILAVSVFNPVGYFYPDRCRRVNNVLRQGEIKETVAKRGGKSLRSSEHFTLQEKIKINTAS